MARPVLKFKIALVLLVSSAVLSLLHVAISGTPIPFSSTFVLDIVFVPIQVLLVTIIIEHLRASAKGR